MIELVDLSVNLNSKQILSGIDMVISKGTWICLVGPNGSGKTTLLRTLLGVLPYSGNIRVNGIETSKKKSLNIGYIPQSPQIPVGMRVNEYISLGRSKTDGWGKANTFAVEKILEEFGLSGLQSSLLNQISGGELQKVLLARVLVQEADILLLDEPTSALDMQHQISVLAHLEEFKLKGKTIISTMHDLTLAAMFADEIAILKNGKMLQMGRAHEMVHAEALKNAFDNQIKVFTLESGDTVIYPERKTTI